MSGRCGRVYYQSCQPQYYQTYQQPQRTWHNPRDISVDEPSSSCRSQYSSIISFTAPERASVAMSLTGRWSNGSYINSNNPWNLTLHPNTVSSNCSAYHMIRRGNTVTIGIRHGFTGNLTIGNQTVSTVIPVTPPPEPEIAQPRIPEHTIVSRSSFDSPGINIFQGTNIRTQAITHIRTTPDGQLQEIPENGLSIGGRRIYRTGVICYEGGGNPPSQPITIYSGRNNPILNLRIIEQELNQSTSPQTTPPQTAPPTQDPVQRILDGLSVATRTPTRDQPYNGVIAFDAPAGTVRIRYESNSGAHGYFHWNGQKATVNNVAYIQVARNRNNTNHFGIGINPNFRGRIIVSVNGRERVINYSPTQALQR